MPEIQIKNLKVQYKKLLKHPHTAISDFSCTFKNHSFNVVLGYSGCGKTTLLKTIAGFLPYEGDILYDKIDARNLPLKLRNIAYVTQNFSLYPHMTVFDNIAYPLMVSGTNKEEIIKRVEEVSKQLGIYHCLTRKPRQISIGQKQRVCIAKSLIKKPDLYLYDEPLSNLDQNRRDELRVLIKKIAQEYNSTVIYVCHNFEEAFVLADEIFIMNEGNIIEKGTPSKILKSKNPITKSLIDIKEK